MLLFYTMFPEVAEAETRTITAWGQKDLPDDTYAFTELYCVEPKCDCQRVMFNVIATKAKKHLATISHSFYKPTMEKDGTTMQSFLDPLNTQSKYADTLLDLFEQRVLDAAFSERVKRHYKMVKTAVDDPKHPVHAIIGKHDEAEQPIRRTQPKTGRNDPCPCGSGKKFKRCCGSVGAGTTVH